MKEDMAEGWWGAPAGEFWTCPDCGETSAVAEWAECEVACEDCGTHDARKCPRCGEDFDHVWGSDAIAKATEAHVDSLPPIVYGTDVEGYAEDLKNQPDV